MSIKEVKRNIFTNHPKIMIGGLIAVLSVILIIVYLFINYPSFLSFSQSSQVSNGQIKHIIVIMQENRSFDSYFGTFPGANGIPSGVCVPDSSTGRCVKPFHDTRDINGGGPHGQTNAAADIDNGKMDGFIAQAQKGGKNCGDSFNPACTNATMPDVMGYHTDGEIPNYWAYAKQFVLQDNMFEPNASWSLPEHLFLVSEWSAKCSQSGNPDSCINALQSPGNPPDFNAGERNSLITKCRKGIKSPPCQALLTQAGITPDVAASLHQLLVQNCKPSQSMAQCENALQNSVIPESLKQKLLNASVKMSAPDYAWTDVTYLLYKHNISWGYYVLDGTEPDCRDDTQASCVLHKQNAKTPGIWNPLPYFDTVKQDGQLSNIQSLSNFFAAAQNGSLPAVSWISPSGDVSEHPPAKVSVGQAYVTTLINAIMKSPNWGSSVILLSWDDWGGFYDHVVPPSIDENGYGLRVPGIIISPFAKSGYIDHQVLSHDAYNKFIEDVFLNSQRIDPKTDGRPDPRPGVRENAPQLGNIFNDLDFSQKPQPPLLLNAHPKTDLM